MPISHKDIWHINVFTINGTLILGDAEIEMMLASDDIKFTKIIVSAFLEFGAFDFEMSIIRHS